MLSCKQITQISPSWTCISKNKVIFWCSALLWLVHHLLMMRFQKNYIIKITTSYNSSLSIICQPSQYSWWLDGNWKSYSNLTEKYNSSFTILDTGHFGTGTLWISGIQIQPRIFSAIQKILDNIKHWKPTSKSPLRRNIKNFPIDFILFLIKTLEAFNEIWYFGD